MSGRDEPGTQGRLAPPGHARSNPYLLRGLQDELRPRGALDAGCLGPPPVRCLLRLLRVCGLRANGRDGELAYRCCRRGFVLPAHVCVQCGGKGKAAAEPPRTHAQPPSCRPPHSTHLVHEEQLVILQALHPRAVPLLPALLLHVLNDLRARARHGRFT